MYLLIPDTATARRSSFRPLHPTMYLLIPVRTCNADDRKNFTSHYVSINSPILIPRWGLILLFTSHYVSINSWKTSSRLLHPVTLHPTMYLLIPVSSQVTSSTITYFTSHYVSINSFITNRRSLWFSRSLHPTMYLLIQKPTVILHHW